MAVFNIYAGEKAETGGDIQLAIVKLELIPQIETGLFKLLLRQYVVRPFYYDDDKKDDLATKVLDRLRREEPEELLDILEEEDIKYSGLIEHLTGELDLSEEVSMGYYDKSFKGEDDVEVYFEDFYTFDSRTISDIDWVYDKKLGEFLETMRLSFHAEYIPAPLALFITNWLKEYEKENPLDESMENWVAFESYRLD